MAYKLTSARAHHSVVDDNCRYTNAAAPWVRVNVVLTAGHIARLTISWTPPPTQAGRSISSMHRALLFVSLAYCVPNSLHTTVVREG